MTNQEILEKSIQKATEGGWQNTHMMPITKWSIHPELAYEFIFNHDFAKALWGEKLPDIDWEATDRTRGWFGIADGVSGYAEYDGPNWEFHLQQMVIAEDPIKYLGENI